MEDIKTPCESCIHNKVCNTRECFEETEVKTTHPYIKVILECTEFYAKPHQRELENTFGRLNMADIELVIKIPEETKQAFDCAESNDLKGCYYDHGGVIGTAIKNGTQPKTGYWIGHREHCENLGVMPSGLGAYEWCSNCDCAIDVREWHRNNYNYCPNCGLKMVEPQETEE